MLDPKNIILIPTIDYEIYGNGSGDIKHDLLEPTSAFLKLAKKYKIRLTFFFEAAEYFAFEKFDLELVSNLGYSPASEIRNQIKEAYQDGHDIQLHFHPQWLHANYKGNKWYLDFSKWRVADLEYDEIDSFLTRGKKFLEDLLKPINRNYRCNAFRAGAWSVQPSKKISKALLQNGFQIDSSVAKYQKSNDKLTNYNFRKVPKSNYWSFIENVCKYEKEGILEISIYSDKTNFIKNIIGYIRRRKAKNKSRSGSYSIGLMQNVKNTFFTNYKSLDICSTSAADFSSSMKKIIKHDVTPIVLIGHSKDLKDINQVESLFAEMSNYHNQTISRFYQGIINET